MIYTKEYVRNLSPNGLRHFFIANKDNLVGSAVFTCSESFISKAICGITKNNCAEKFIPSHIGSICFTQNFNPEIDEICKKHKLEKEKFYLMDMKPPKGSATNFFDYVQNTEDDFVIVMRNFELNTLEFSSFVLGYVGKIYGYASALQCAFVWFYYPYKKHCSEIHQLALKKQGLFLNSKRSPNASTPESLYHLLRGENDK